MLHKKNVEFCGGVNYWIAIKPVHSSVYFHLSEM
jgi:hypothetical protein